MHRVLMVLALAACYSPGREAPCTITCGAAGACPDGLTCNTTIDRCALANGSCGTSDASTDSPLVVDAPDDGGLVDGSMVDASTIGLCTPSGTANKTAIGSGIWFTPDLDRVPTGLAVKYDGTEPVVTEGDVNGTSYTTLIPAETDVAFSNPRLAPSNDEVIYIRNQAGVVSLQRAKRVSQGNWASSPLMLKTELGALPVVIRGDEQIGAPTTTTPRHMLIQSFTTLDEYVEASTTTWHRVRRHMPSFGAITFIGHATLNEDGRRMVFKGHEPPTMIGGYYADRAAVGGAFSSGATRIPGQGTDSVDTPYLSEDCRHYYYSFMGQVVHVTL